MRAVLFAFVFFGCTVEQGCDQTSDILFEAGHSVNTCKGVRIRQPERCGEWGYVEVGECTLRKTYICGNGQTLVMEMNTATGVGFMLVRDAASGCESWYPLEATS